MRDRLSQLQAFSQANGHHVEEVENAVADFPSRNTRHEKGPQEHGSDAEMEAVLDEALGIRRDIQLILLDVKHLKELYARVYGEITSCPPTAVQQDSRAIAANVKTRSEDLLQRLQKMDIHARELEEQHGASGTVPRIARTQYTDLSSSFREAVKEYNEAEMIHREMCKSQIQRQMEIVGRDVTGEEIEEMLENGQWNIFSENMLTDGKTARSALNQIESRHQDLLELEKRIKNIHELFLDIAMLVDEQNSMIDYIQTNVQNTEAEMKNVLMKLERAKRHDRSHPFKKIFFWRR
ncbi:syntaxin-11-like [Hoplias malabaricus]|uniref:syntaxin-11-like n=1 Tax=Hoplias malabaricus TaxID=27720 RepID=UPI0034628F50